mgnify:CR=1 FL=1|jgi:hypothetical protein
MLVLLGFCPTSFRSVLLFCRTSGEDSDHSAIVDHSRVLILSLATRYGYNPRVRFVSQFPVTYPHSPGFQSVSSRSVSEETPGILACLVELGLE